MPIRLRLALIVAAGLVVLLAASGWAFLHQLRGSLTASIDSSLWSRRQAMLTNISQHATPTLFDGTQILSASGRVVLQSTDDTGSGPLITKRQLDEARGGPVWLDAPSRGESPARVLAFPLPPGSPGSVAVVSTSMELLDAAVSHVEDGFLFGGPVVVLGGAFAGWLLAGASLRPVERMRRQAANATAEDDGPVLDVPSTRDELAALAKTMNELLGRLHGALARERAFVADAGHELRTPLSILRTELELAARPGRSRDELVAAVHAAEEETERLTRLAEALLLLARGGDAWLVRREHAQVRPLLEASVAGLRSRARGKEIQVEVEVEPEGLTATWDEDRIRQIVSNLVDNALRFSPAGGRIDVSGRGVAGRILLTVHDQGPGFPEEFLPHAFERFSRADAARSADGGGAGLGLSIVALIAGAHGGVARARNDPRGGAVVEVEIPEPDAAPAPRSRPRAPANM